MNENDLKWGNEQVEAFRLGSVTAFRRLFDHLAPTLNYFVEHMVNDTQEAENIVSSAFFKAWTLRANFEALPNLRAFLYTTSKNEAYDLLRYKASIRDKQILSSEMDKLDLPVEDHSSDAEMEIIKAQLLQAVKAQIDLLPENRRSVMSLLQQGYKVKDVAERLKLSEENVRVLKTRSLEQIRKNLKGVKWGLFLLLLSK